MKNAIYIVGAGAIGKTLAVFLSRAGRDVTLVRGSVNDSSNYEEVIEVKFADQTKVRAAVKVSTINNFPILDGLVVLTNKSYGNFQLAEVLKSKIENSPLIVLQNGLNVEQPFVENEFPLIYRCVLFATSQPISGDCFMFKPVDVSPIGALETNSVHHPGTLTKIVGALDNEFFRFRAELNIQPLIWKKVIVNSVFNSICPLIEADNGIFYRNETALKMAKRVIGECVAIANSIGIALDAEEVVKSLLHISKSSDGQLISTYQDIINKRKTEIETLNFAIAQVAEQSRLGDVVRETKLLGELVKMKADLAD